MPLTLDHSLIAGNIASGNSGAEGGGVYGSSGMDVESTSISANTAVAGSPSGPGTADGGGLYADGPTVMMLR